ncbi:transketolase [Enterococcus casseliflavus]
MFDKIDQLCVDTIRTLSIDTIEAANSGHPGLPMGAAPMAYVLWSKHLKINPETSDNWLNRDRFVLSAGHGSAMLYSLLHLSGFQLTIEDLKSFRQWGSKTPGHPEVHHTDGVEATSGPLGQGIAQAVGIAMAEAHLSATFNRPGYPVIDHYTYALCGDGDLMEGVSQEASSLAGHWKLGKLIVLYDSNDITLDGPLVKTFTESVAKRYEALGWQYLRVENGNDLEAISQAIDDAKTDTEHPTLIEIKTVIGYGSVKEGTSAIHGTPLDQEDIRSTKKKYGWRYPKFKVPKEVMSRFNEKITKFGASSEREWQRIFTKYNKLYPEMAEKLMEFFSRKLPEKWDENLPVYDDGTYQSTRDTSNEIIQVLSDNLPSLWGGSADLSSSNKTMMASESDFEYNNYVGRNIWFGVREFGMASIMNGILLHGVTQVYGGTFFAFIDYLRPALRMSALQGLPAIYILTHDSVAVGEDGPTHEPIEQLASIRCMPNVHTIRPADANETVAAWRVAVESVSTPTILVLSRQKLPVLNGTKDLAFIGVERGAYVLSPAKGKPEGIIIGTGSEVDLAMKAQKILLEQGKDVSVVSMPSFELFEEQDILYKESVFPSNVTKRLAIEAGSSFGWDRYAKATITIDHFGTSAPGDKILAEYGFTVENVVSMYNYLE